MKTGPVWVAIDFTTFTTSYEEAKIRGDTSAAVLQSGV